MASPIAFHSVQDQSAAGAGDDRRTLGHHLLTLFVEGDTANLSSLTVQLEISPDGDQWSEVEDEQGNVVEITLSDLSNDVGTGADTYAEVAEVYAPYVRARVTDYTGSVGVDAYVFTGGYPGQGRRAGLKDGQAGEL